MKKNRTIFSFVATLCASAACTMTLQSCQSQYATPILSPAPHGRELLTADEVRMLDNQYAIVFIRGERPVLDFKYDLLTHPNISLGVDGGADAYTHDIPELVDVTTIEIVNIEDYEGKTMEDFPKAEEYLANLVAYDDEETEAMCDYLENKNEKENSE